MASRVQVISGPDRATCIAEGRGTFDVNLLDAAGQPLKRVRFNLFRGRTGLWRFGDLKAVEESDLGPIELPLALNAQLVDAMWRGVREFLRPVEGEGGEGRS